MEGELVGLDMGFQARLGAERQVEGDYFLRESGKHGN